MLIITGPTCSGKSDLAASLASLCDAIVINADSKQVYAELPIITNQPVYIGVQHELYGTRTIAEPYSVIKWLEDIEQIILANPSRKIIIVGGSGMYVNALLYGISDIPSDWNIKMELNKIVKERTLDYIAQKLFKLDPISAEKLHPNDTHRILRAYEVLLLTGKSIYSFFGAKKPIDIAKNISIKIAITPEIGDLYKKIDDRFISMLNNGAIEEVILARSLIQGERLASSGIQGFVELSLFLDGDISMEKAAELAQRNTRRYAKRQMTWIRNQQSDFQLFNSAPDAYNALCATWTK